LESNLKFKNGYLILVYLCFLQVRRQRQAEQELTLKECQQQTEQLQLWLSDIARTLDNATRVNDQSQLQVSITLLKYNFDGLNK